MSDDPFAAWENEIDDIEVDELDMSTLSLEELMDICIDTEQQLYKTGHPVWPTTQEGRDLTSRHQAALIWIKKRTGTYPPGFERDP